MVLLYVIIGAVTSVGLILLRYYLSERKKDSNLGNHCFNCNLNFPKNYNVCPNCGMRFGT